MKITAKLKEKETRKHFIIFVVLMMLLFVLYFAMKQVLLYQKWEKVYSSNDEFVQTIDCANIFRKYGVDCDYVLEFEAKSEIPGEILVYIQKGNVLPFENGSYIKTTEKFQKYTITIHPTQADMKELGSYLVLYGKYGTGVKPTVYHVSLKKK